MAQSGSHPTVRTLPAPDETGTLSSRPGTHPGCRQPCASRQLGRSETLKPSPWTCPSSVRVRPQTASPGHRAAAPAAHAPSGSLGEGAPEAPPVLKEAGRGGAAYLAPAGYGWCPPGAGVRGIGSAYKRGGMATRAVPTVEGAPGPPSRRPPGGEPTWRARGTTTGAGRAWWAGWSPKAASASFILGLRGRPAPAFLPGGKRWGRVTPLPHPAPTPSPGVAPRRRDHLLRAGETWAW